MTRTFSLFLLLWVLLLAKTAPRQLSNSRASFLLKTMKKDVGWWIDGDWPSWLTLLLSSDVFTWITHRITRVSLFLKP